MILEAGYGTVSDFEIVWTMIAIIGFCFAIANLVGVISDYKFEKDRIKAGGQPNGIWYLAKVAVLTESGRAYLQLVFIYLGLISMTLADPPPSVGLGNQVRDAVARWGLLTASLLVVVKTCYAWYVRKRLAEERQP